MLLPLGKPELQTMTLAADNPPEPPVNILLVDDLPANLLALQAILADLGQNLVRAAPARKPCATCSRRTLRLSCWMSRCRGSTATRRPG